METSEITAKIKEAKDEIKKEGEAFKQEHLQIPELSWSLFLKCFDDFEKTNELRTKGYEGIIPKPLRWRDWATDKGVTGDLLIKKVDELFREFQKLQPEKGKEERNIFGTIFRKTPNRIRDGYRLRKIINFVDEISFLKQNDIDNFVAAYETELYEMVKSAEKAAYYYTPRAVTKFITNVIKPNFTKGERVWDPACGFGGFLIESLKMMEKYEDSVELRKKLRYETLFANEKDAQTFLCGILNTMTNGISRPNFSLINTLSKHTREISADDQYEVIMTNPTYGGQEDKTIKKNLPLEFQTGDTALHFLYYVMESLKKNGRAAIILPAGVLNGTKGVFAKIKKELFEKFNLHTIIRLAGSTFDPYTSISPNILFFDKNGPTKEIWYYQMYVSERLKVEGKKTKPHYSKSKPIEDQDFADVLEWIKDKTKNQNAWKVSVDEIEEYNLDIKNPNDKVESINLSPHKLIKQIIEDEKKTLDLLDAVKKLIDEEIPEDEEEKDEEKK